jgi:hypothetical protein
MEKVPETFSASMPLLVQESRYADDRKMEDLISLKSEVLFMAGSFDGPVRKTSQAAHTNNYVP